MTPEQRAAELEANRLRKLKAIRRERLIVVTVELTSESRILNPGERQIAFHPNQLS